MAWKEQSPRFTPAGDRIDDPYRAAALTWDGRYGEAVVQARNWRVVAMGSLLISALLAGGTIWALQQRSDIPYVVVLDQQGDTMRLELAEKAYTPSEAQIAYHLRQWITWVRARPLDPLLFKKNWEQAYAFLSGEAKAKMNSHAREHDPKAELGRVARDVRIKNIRQRTPNAFEVAWIEEDWQDGQRVRQAHYSGSFLIEITPPTTAEKILQNPLGILITEFGWSPDVSLQG